LLQGTEHLSLIIYLKEVTLQDITATVWAEVLDTDAFQAFKEKGLFDQELAKSFRENILSKGGTEDPMELFIRFRGAEPKIDALLEGRGLN